MMCVSITTYQRLVFLVSCLCPAAMPDICFNCLLTSLVPCHCCVSCAPLIAQQQRSTRCLVRRPSIAPDGCCVNNGPHAALEQCYDRSRCCCHGRHGLTMRPRLGCQIFVLAMFIAIFVVFYYHNQASHNKASGATLTAKRCIMCHASCHHHCVRSCCCGLHSHNTSNL